MLPSHAALARSTSQFAVLDIEIIGAEDAKTFNPTTLIVECLTRRGEVDWFPIGSPLPEVKSDVSGEPAFFYRTKEVTLALTKEEIASLTTRSLTPDQFFALHQKHGSFFEIHGDFYDEATGVALWPTLC